MDTQPPSSPAGVGQLVAPQEYAALMRGAFECSSVALVAWDSRGVLMLMNKAAERLFGLKAGYALGHMHGSELFEPAELSALAADLTITLQRDIEEEEALVLHSETTRHYGRPREWTMRRMDGARFPATVSLSELEVHPGDPHNPTLAAVTNISARKRTAEAFLAKQRQLEEFIHHTPVAVALLDNELCYLATSHRWIVDYALPDQDIRGRSHLELFPNLPRHWRDAYLRCLGGSIERHDGDRFQRPDGRVDWIRWECHPWYRLDGEVGGITIFSEVITEKHLAQQRLRASEAQLNEAQHLARIGSWELNPVTQQMSWSLETYRIHGLSPGSQIDLERAVGFYVPDHRPIIRHAFEKAIRDGQGWDFELQIDNAVGRRLWVRAIGKVELQADKPVRVFGTFQDISERKRWENEILHAKDEALAAARAKSDFLANMSHEIRTPLNAVIGMASLLLDSKLNEDERECANTIRTASESLLQIINQILDFSKIESGKIDLENQPFGLSECVETAVEIIAPIAAEKKLELHCWIDPRVPAVVLGDVTRLRQILVNLVANAVKFTQEGEVEVLVRPVQAAPESEEASELAEPEQPSDAAVELEFSVRDTGIGIPTERMDRLFKSFSQVDSSTTRQYGGTGLGLAICRRLVELMDGRIWAESTPGVGSTFTFVIPCYREASSQVEPQATPLKGQQILLLMPAGNGRRLLRAYLESWGAEASAADSSVDALDIVRKSPRPAALVMDSGMVDESPLLQETRILGIPVVLLSPLGIRPSGSSFEPAATLSKPLKPRLLLAALQRVFSHSPQKVSMAGALSAPLRKGEHKLVLAEDNLVNQRVALSMLKRMGWEVKLAANGSEAVKVMLEEPLRFVLMDMQMPEMDGLAATRELRRVLPADRQPIIIALTANALPGDREKCLAAGMNDYLSKPIHPEELRAKLDHWLERLHEVEARDAATSVS